MGSRTAQCDRKSAGRPLRLVQEEIAAFYKSIKPFWQRCKTLGNQKWGNWNEKLKQETWGNHFSPFSCLGNKMKLSFETKKKLSWQQWNQVCFPVELSLYLLPDLWPLLTWEIFTFLLNLEGFSRRWGFPGGCAVRESGSLGWPGEHKEPADNQPHPNTSLMAGCTLKMCFCRMGQRERHVRDNRLLGVLLFQFLFRFIPLGNSLCTMSTAATLLKLGYGSLLLAPSTSKS